MAFSRRRQSRFRKRYGKRTFRRYGSFKRGRTSYMSRGRLFKRRAYPVARRALQFAKGQLLVSDAATNITGITYNSWSSFACLTNGPRGIPASSSEAVSTSNVSTLRNGTRFFGKYLWLRFNFSPGQAENTFNTHVRVLIFRALTDAYSALTVPATSILQSTGNWLSNMDLTADYKKRDYKILRDFTVNMTETSPNVQKNVFIKCPWWFNYGQALTGSSSGSTGWYDPTIGHIYVGYCFDSITSPQTASFYVNSRFRYYGVL